LDEANFFTDIEYKLESSEVNAIGLKRSLPIGLFQFPEENLFPIYAVIG
jgi:hypothetical protein